MCQGERFEGERLLVHLGLHVLPCVLPHGHVGEVHVVPQRLALLGLVFLAEVAAAALITLERVAAHQLGELEEVRKAPRVLEGLVDSRSASHDAQIVPEAIA